VNIDIYFSSVVYNESNNENNNKKGYYDHKMFEIKKFTLVSEVVLNKSISNGD
jgi:hypothetical protein